MPPEPKNRKTEKKRLTKGAQWKVEKEKISQIFRASQNPHVLPSVNC